MAVVRPTMLTPSVAKAQNWTVQCPVRLGLSRQPHNFLLPRHKSRFEKHVTRTASGSPALPDDAGSSSKPEEKKGAFQAIKKFFVGDKMDKERLAALGMGAFASYAVISNVTYGTCLTIAWISFVKAYNVSPLAPGQWKGFLVFYAGLFTFQNIVRPLRFSLAIALAPLFDKGIDAIGQRTGLAKKWAFGILLGCIASVTTVVLFGTIYLLGGFPPVNAS